MPHCWQQSSGSKKNYQLQLQLNNTIVGWQSHNIVCWWSARDAHLTDLVVDLALPCLALALPCLSNAFAFAQPILDEDKL